MAWDWIRDYIRRDFIIIILEPIAAFMTPSNGKLFYVIYSLLMALGGAGIENCEMNLTYISVPESQRTGALAIRMAISGIAGFVSTLVVSPLVSYIQKCDNHFLGLNVYAQQVLSALSAIITMFIIIYLFKNKDMEIRRKKE